MVRLDAQGILNHIIERDGTQLQLVAAMNKGDGIGGVEKYIVDRQDILTAGRLHLIGVDAIGTVISQVGTAEMLLHGTIFDHTCGPLSDSYGFDGATISHVPPLWMLPMKMKQMPMNLTDPKEVCLRKQTISFI